MIKIAITYFLLLLFQNIYAQPFILNGTIKEKDTGYVILRFRDISNQLRVEIAAINRGKFQFRGIINGIADAILATDSNSILKNKQHYRYLYIESGVMNISFKDGEIRDAEYTGIRSQKEYDVLEESKSEDNKKLKYQDSLLSSIRVLLKNGSIEPKVAEQKLNEIGKGRETIAAEIMNKEISFIKKNPKSYVCLTLIKDLVAYIPNDSIDALYLSISAKVKGSSLDYVFLEYYSRYRKATSAEYPFDKLVINGVAPSFFIYKYINNDSLNLLNFKGKAVLLEFWGLDCLPCLRQNPLLEEIRKKYDKDKLVIIGINQSQELKMPELISYIQKNKLSEWLHVATDKTVKPGRNLINNGSFENYSGLGVPRTVLIDKKGKVIYINHGYSPEDIQKLKSFLDKAVNENTTSGL